MPSGCCDAEEACCGDADEACCGDAAPSSADPCNGETDGQMETWMLLVRSAAGLRV